MTQELTTLENDRSCATRMRLPFARLSFKDPNRSSLVSRCICLSLACMRYDIEDIAGATASQPIMHTLHARIQALKNDKSHSLADAMRRKRLHAFRQLALLENLTR